MWFLIKGGPNNYGIIIFQWGPYEKLGGEFHGIGLNLSLPWNPFSSAFKLFQLGLV